MTQSSQELSLHGSRCDSFGLFLTPVFYVVLRRLAGNRPLQQHGSHVAPISEPGHGASALPMPAAPRGHDE